MTLPTLLLIIVLALLAAYCIKRIPEGQVYTLRRFGRPAGVLSAGTHMVWPLVESIGHKISIAGHMLAVDERIESPAQARVLRGRVWWQVLEPERVDAMIERADELIRTQLRDAVHSAEASQTGEPPHGHRHARNQRIKQTLNGQLRARGLLVTRVEIDLAA